MTPTPAPDTDAAMVLGMASTALPFARTAEEEAERWLRILRMHGKAGIALQAIGVSEGPLEAPVGEGSSPAPPSRARSDAVAAVTDEAAIVASRRGSERIRAGDVLVAVMHVYGADFDRVLRVHGTDRDEVLQRLRVEMAGQPQG